MECQGNIMSLRIIFSRFGVGLMAVATYFAIGEKPVFAGASAHVHACIYLSAEPASAVEFKFTAGSENDTCMYANGNNESLKVSNSGLHCKSVGKVRGKSSLGCATEDSKWTLGYRSTTKGTSYSGSTQSLWSHPSGGRSKVTLENQSRNTYVCSTENKCTSTKQSWDVDWGKIYIIFTPGP